MKKQKSPSKITKREIDILLFKIDSLLKEKNGSNLQKA